MDRNRRSESGQLIHSLFVLSYHTDRIIIQYSIFFFLLEYSLQITFQVACETFCLDDDDTLLEVALSLGSEALSAATVRFVEAEPQPIGKGIFTNYF